MKNCSYYPPRIHRTLSTTPLRNRPEKLLQLLPPPSNLEFTELYRQPPLRNRPEKLLQLPPPPSNSPNFIDNPPSKSSSPLEFTELYRQPLLRNRPEKLLQLPPPRIHRTLSTTPSLRNRPEKLLQLPPSNSPNFIDNPPFEIVRRNCSNYPPRIHRTLSTTPLRNRPTPSRIHGTLSTTPLSKSSGETVPTTPPPSNSPNFIDNPPSKSSYPLSNSPNFIDNPPSKSSGETAPTTPLEFTELYRLTPLPNILPWISPDFVEL